MFSGGIEMKCWIEMDQEVVFKNFSGNASFLVELQNSKCCNFTGNLLHRLFWGILKNCF